MNNILLLAIIGVSIAVVMYMQVANGLSDKEIEERDKEIEERKEKILNKLGTTDEEIERGNKMLDNHIAQLDRIKRQVVCSAFNEGLANYSLGTYKPEYRYKWNQDVDACQRPDGTIILNTTLETK